MMADGPVDERKYKNSIHLKSFFNPTIQFLRLCKFVIKDSRHDV